MPRVPPLDRDVPKDYSEEAEEANSQRKIIALEQAIDCDSYWRKKDGNVKPQPVRTIPLDCEVMNEIRFLGRKFEHIVPHDA